MERPIIKLKCECGKDFERQDVPEDWKKIITYKWKFQYCDACYKNRVNQALNRMPEVLRVITDGIIKDEQRTEP
jgi:hypothetical protein